MAFYGTAEAVPFVKGVFHAACTAGNLKLGYGKEGNLPYPGCFVPSRLRKMVDYGRFGELRKGSALG
jgi:hypothetical protein